MSLGDALVLASVIFAPIYLYKITRDRWNWKRGERRFLQGFFLLIAAGFLLWWSTDKINNIPSRQIEYADLRLGMTMAEARYAKGAPDDVYKEETDGQWKNFYQVIHVNELKGQAAEDFRHWSYNYSNVSVIVIDFDVTNKINSIRCYSKGFMDCPMILGFRDGSSENEIKGKLGSPTTETIDSDSGVKTLAYTPLNLHFYLLKKKIYMFGIASPPQNN